MQPLVHLVLVVVQLLFASLAVAGRYVLLRFPAGALVSLRVLGAVLVLGVVNWLVGTPGDPSSRQVNQAGTTHCAPRRAPGV